MTLSAPTERSPRPGWTRHGYVPGTGGTLWSLGRLRVISSLYLDAELPDGSGHGPQWHVSITSNGRRPKPREVKRALAAFGMVGAEEDNHHPGNARHFWMPVDPAHRVDCECKVDEILHTEPDGYRWTNPRPEEGPCRGCELAPVSGRPCPIHAEAADG